MSAVETNLHPLFSLVMEIWRHRTANSMTCYFEDLRIVITPLTEPESNQECCRLQITLGRADFAEAFQKIRGSTLVTETLMIDRRGWCHFQVSIQTHVPSFPATTLNHTIEAFGFRLDQDDSPDTNHRGRQRLAAIMSLVEQNIRRMTVDHIDARTGYWSVNTADQLVFTPGRR